MTSPTMFKNVKHIFQETEHKTAD